MRALDFEEIITPSIIGTASEGGTEVFPVVYFDKEAFLLQSPQLYKQLAVIGGMERVYMTPQYLELRSITRPHILMKLQPWMRLDLQTKVAMEILSEVFLHILQSVNKNCNNS